MGQDYLLDIIEACPLKDWVDNHIFTLRIGYDEDVKLIVRLRVRDTRHEFKKEYYSRYCEAVIGHLDDESLNDLISCINESYLSLTRYALQIGTLVNKLHQAVERNESVRHLISGEYDGLVALLQKLDQGNFNIKWANYIQKLENYSKTI